MHRTGLRTTSWSGFGVRLGFVTVAAALGLAETAMAQPGSSLAAYRCDENGGPTAFDSSGHNNHGTNSVVTYTLDTPFPAPDNYAVEFDHEWDAVTIPAGPSTNLNSYTALTLEAHIKPTMTSGLHFILWADDGPFGLLIRDNELCFELVGSSGSATRSVPFTATGVWTHVAGTWDGATSILYVNAAPVDSGAAAVGTVTVSPVRNIIRIGNDETADLNGFNRDLRGLLDEVRILDRALSAVEVAFDATHSFSQPRSLELVNTSVDEFGFVRIPDDAALQPQQMSVECWIRPEGVGFGQTFDDFGAVIVGKLREDVGGACLGSFALGWAPPTGLVVFAVVRTFGSDCAAAFSTTTIPIGTTAHVAGTYDGQTIRIYVNGQLENSTTYPGPIYYGPEPLLIGAANFAGGFLRRFHGEVDDLRLWNYVRDQGTIASNMNCRLRGDEPGLLAYYPFDNGPPDIVVDYSCNNHHGDIEGVAAFPPDLSVLSPCNGLPPDCNANDITDCADLQLALGTDADGNGIPDECGPDCDGDGDLDFADYAELADCLAGPDAPFAPGCECGDADDDSDVDLADFATFADDFTG